MTCVLPARSERANTMQRRSALSTQHTGLWRSRPGYTLLEMLTTIAALIIVLGLMVGLARSVRSASAQELTKDLLRKLDVLMDRYYAANGRLPDVAPLVPAEEWQMTEPVLQRNAYQNNRQVVAA